MRRALLALAFVPLIGGQAHAQGLTLALRGAAMLSLTGSTIVDSLLGLAVGAAIAEECDCLNIVKLPSHYISKMPAEYGQSVTDSRATEPHWKVAYWIAPTEVGANGPLLGTWSWCGTGVVSPSLNPWTPKIDASGPYVVGHFIAWDAIAYGMYQSFNAGCVAQVDYGDPAS